jgi:subtilisin family serine protease
VAAVFCLLLPSFAQAAIIPNDTFWQKEWHLRQIHAEDAWEVTTGSAEVIVALIDGGVDIAHPELEPNIWTNTREIPGDGLDNDGNGYRDDVHGWNYVTDSGDVRPVYLRTQSDEAWSHGTITASLLGAVGNNDRGVMGVAWKVRIMPLVVLDGDGNGGTRNIIYAMRYAMAQGAKVINLSLVGYEYDEERAHDAGVLVVAATGNEGGMESGIDLDFMPGYPACLDAGKRNLILGVSGTDTLDQKAPYANYGHDCTDLSAPGQEMFAARPRYPRGDAATSTVSGYIDDVTGTSLATPLVSGVAVLLWSVHPEWTVDQVRDRILDTVDPIDSLLPERLRGKMGMGRLNAGRALAGLGSATTTLTGPQPAASSTVKLISNPRSPFVTFVDAQGRSEKRAPYGEKVLGTQAVRLADGGWLLFPIRGGGHVMLFNAEGKLIASGFPFGRVRNGAWLVQVTKQGMVSVSGPGGFRTQRPATIAAWKTL